jgi:glycosyltransferase involved in cell wall biosynthesis
MSINVLHLIGGGEIGGAEQNVLNLLKNLDRQSVNPFLGCLAKGSALAPCAQSFGIPSEIFPMQFPFDLSPLPTIIAFCRKHKIALIHAHGTRANLLGRTVARLTKIPCISTIHSLPEYDYPSSLKGRISLWVDNLTLHWSAGIIAVSVSLSQSAAIRLNRKGLTLPVNVIYNGSEIFSFTQPNQMLKAFREQWSIPDHCLVIGTIGRLHPVKGQFYLIEAMKLLTAEIPDLHLLIIGEGPLHNQLTEQLKLSGLPFTLTGYLPSAWQALPAMDLFVFPSLSEGMGLVLLEAAQAGIPIVASKVGGIPELLEDHKEALLVPPADPAAMALACSKVLKGRAFSAEMTARARQKVSQFSIEKMVQDTITFYEKIIS